MNSLLGRHELVLLKFVLLTRLRLAGEGLSMLDECLLNRVVRPVVNRFLRGSGVYRLIGGLLCRKNG
jgi:hypothetical protein